MNTYTIYTCEDFTGAAPANMRWAASFSPLDDGEITINGYGATEWDAMADLCTNHDLPEEPSAQDDEDAANDALGDES